MKILRDGGKTTVLVNGRIDAYGAPKFAEEIKAAVEGTEDLTLDFADLEYISSSGLRAVMLAAKAMARQGTMRIIRARESVYGVMELTGFTAICDVERAEEK